MVQFPGSRETIAHIGLVERWVRKVEHLLDVIIGLLKAVGILAIVPGLVYLGFGVYGLVVSAEDIRPILEWPYDPTGVVEFLTQRKALPLIAVCCLNIAGGIMLFSFGKEIERRSDNAS